MKKYKLIVGHYSGIPEFDFGEQLNAAVEDGWEVIPVSLRIADTSSGDIARVVILLVRDV